MYNERNIFFLYIFCAIINHNVKYDNFIFLQLRTVWVSCEGETVSDKELIGPISYWPIPGFPGYFFPFENSEGYLSPLVAIHFKRPASEYFHCIVIKRRIYQIFFFLFKI